MSRNTDALRRPATSGKRRRFLLSILGAAGLTATRTWAQQRRIARIGVLWHAGSPEEEAIWAAPMRQGFSDIGLVEGRDYELLETYAGERYERFRDNAERLVNERVDVIVAVTGPAAAAAQRATATLPVVFLLVPDPVGRKLARSLSNPGGNLTGMSTVAVDLSAKRLEQIREAIPGLRRLGLVVNANDAPTSRSVTEHTRAAAQPLDIEVQTAEIRELTDLERAFAEMARSDIRAAVLMQDPLFFNQRKRVSDLGRKHRIATIVGNSAMVRDGCFMSYAPDFGGQFRRVGGYVDRILKGRSPAEIPIDEPTKLELVINLKVAAELGVTISPALLARVDEVIE